MPLEQAFTVLFDSSDVEVGTASNPLRIDPTGTTTQPISGTVTANQGTAASVGNAWPILVTDGTNTAAVLTTDPGGAAAGLVVRVAGTVSTTVARPGTSTITSVSVGTTNTTILAANTNRLGAILYNDSNTRTFVKLGATASTTSFTVRLEGRSTFELQSPVYTGIIDGITAAGTSTILATELTA